MFVYKVIGKTDTPITKPVLINVKDPEPEEDIDKLFGIFRTKLLSDKDPENIFKILEPLLKIFIGTLVF